MFLSRGNIRDFNTGHFAINLSAWARILHNKGIHSSRFNFQQQQQEWSDTMSRALILHLPKIYKEKGASKNHLHIVCCISAVIQAIGSSKNMLFGGKCAPNMNAGLLKSYWKYKSQSDFLFQSGESGLSSEDEEDNGLNSASYLRPNSRKKIDKKKRK
jgi:hypothetical protein